MLERFLYSGDFRRWGVRWIGCGSEHGHASWIGLDCVSKFVDWVGLDLAKRTQVQLCAVQADHTIFSFYRAMHFSAKRGIAIACRLSVRPSVCLSVWSLVNCDHISWNSSKIISPLVSLGRSLFATPTRRVCSKGSAPIFSPE